MNRVEQEAKETVNIRSDIRSGNHEDLGEGFMKKEIRKNFRKKIVCMAATLCLSLGVLSSGSFQMESAVVLAEENASSAITGSYSVNSEWVRIDQSSDTEKEVYKKEASQDMEETSEITCSYFDTNYSVAEYEQLRDMLTTNLMYSDVNAQISTSAGYTDAKDYLYTLTADDSDKDYRDIYYYVVGDYRCFCVTVREYREEAAQADSSDDTPQEVGKKTAQQFTWNQQG